MEMERRNYPATLGFEESLELIAKELREFDIDVAKTKHDIISYESYDYQREILTDANAFYDAFRKAMKGSSWKPQVQQFEANYLIQVAKLQKELMALSYRLSPTTDFILRERGKIRYVSGEHIRDRVVKHILCDEVLSPEIRRYLVYDNGASITGKGMEFTRNRLLTHLRKFYAQHGSNRGFILLIDFTKYYDNIRHAYLKELFDKYIDLSPLQRAIINIIIDGARIDVSYMDDQEYSQCLFHLFNSLEYQKIPHELRTGEKFMDKHMNIGDQLSQIAGILYPTRMDNYIKIVKGMKFYGRYMDDSYVIHENPLVLAEILRELKEIAAELDSTINENKTRIVPLNEGWKFLQITYILTETGRVIHKINSKRLIAMRRKLKKLAPNMPIDDFDQLYLSWFRAHYKYMSKLQRESIELIYNKLREVTLP